MHFKINQIKFEKLITEYGYYSFYLAEKTGNVKLVIVHEITKNKVRVVKPIKLLPIIIESLEEGNTSEGIAKVKRNLIVNHEVWNNHIVNLLPNHFFTFMESEVSPHKNHLVSKVLAQYISKYHLGEYKGSVITGMIEEYAGHKNYEVVWSKGKIRFSLNVHRQKELNFKNKMDNDE